MATNATMSETTAVQAQNERLSFAFARDHGVLLQWQHAEPVLFCRANVSPQTLQEVRRLLRQTF